MKVSPAILPAPSRIGSPTTPSMPTTPTSTVLPSCMGKTTDASLFHPAVVLVISGLLVTDETLGGQSQLLAGPLVLDSCTAVWAVPQGSFTRAFTGRIRMRKGTSPKGGRKCG